MRRSPPSLIQSVKGPELPPTIFVIGCGDGALLSAIGDANPQACAIVLDPDPGAVQHLLTRRDWSERIRAGRLTLLSGPEYSGASGSWRPAMLPPTDPPILVDPDTAARDPRGVADAQTIVARIISEARANAEARRTHAGRYLLHTLSNAPRIAREGDAAALFGAFAGRPAIVVGAGPSLDGSISALAACRDRALIVACDTAARPLMAAGVVPHVIVAVDPAESNAMHLAALHNPRGSWLVAEGSVHPNGLPAFDGRTFVFNVADHEPWPWLRSLGVARGRLAAWGSVATSALDLVLRMGCTRVIFAGLDFAFTGGRTYCRGTTFEAQWATWMAGGESFDAIWRMLISRWPAVMEPDDEGRMVRTAPHLVAFRNWMRERMDTTTGVRFINATPGGIFHGHRLETLTLEEALADSASMDAREFDRQMRRLHGAVRPASAAVFDAIHELVDVPDLKVGPTYERWIEFGAGTVRREMIAGALRSREYQAWLCGRQSTASAPGM